MAPKTKKGSSTPKKKKGQARPRPRAKVSEPETATEEVESSTPEPRQGSKNRQSKKVGIKVTALVHAAAAAAGVPGANGNGEEDELLPDGKYNLCTYVLIYTYVHEEILRMPASDHLTSTYDPRVYRVLSRLVRVCTAFTPCVRHAVAIAPNF